MSPRIWVVLGAEGDYDEYREFICGVFTNKDTAIQLEAKVPNGFIQEFELDPSIDMDSYEVRFSTEWPELRNSWGRTPNCTRLNLYGATSGWGAENEIVISPLDVSIVVRAPDEDGAILKAHQIVLDSL